MRARVVDRAKERVSRNTLGTSMLELPVGIWFMLIVFFIPMLVMSSITLRSTLMNVVVQDAAHDAAKARTFESATPDGPPAIVIAANTVQGRIAHFQGLTVTAVDTDILVTNIDSGQTTRFENKLPAPADAARFVYQIETTITGSIEPLLGANSQAFGDIPGLTVPMSIVYSARQMFENPQGLNR